MAKIAELNIELWDEWVSTRPPVVRDLCLRYPPDRLYRLNTGQRVEIIAYNEDGTITVDVNMFWNYLVFERRVFGVNPTDLEECDLPKDDEVLGAALTDEHAIKEFCNFMRREKE